MLVLAEAKITEEHIFFILEMEYNIFKYHKDCNEKGKWKSDELQEEENLAGVDLTFLSISSCCAIAIFKLLKTHQSKFTHLL